MDVSSFIDLHFHIGPEVVPRKFDVDELARHADGRIAGIALKSHCYPTMPMIKSASVPERLTVIGSVTLNNFVGGLNPDAVFSSARVTTKTPIIVWFPTVHSANHLDRLGHEFPIEWFPNGFRIPAGSVRSSKMVKGITVMDNGSLTSDCLAVLKAIEENGCILATGHLAWQESCQLVSKAHEMGIRRIVVTHPIYQHIDMPIEIQRGLSRLDGVYIEHCYAMHLIDRKPGAEIAAQIREVGADKCILSSDMGQLNNPDPDVALGKFCALLKGEGIKTEELVTMGCDNPRKVLG